MAELTRAELNAGLADNTTGAIVPQNVRDIVDSAVLPQDLTGVGITIDTSNLPAITFTAATGAQSLDELTDVSVDDQTTPINSALKWNGSQWVAAPPDYNFTFSCTLGVSPSGLQLIGTGIWKVTGLLSFSASYTNGPATSAYITSSAWGGALTLNSPYTSGVSNVNTNYPGSPGSSISFALNASAGAESSSASQSVTFDNYIYYGTTLNNGTFTSSDVLGLTGKILSNSKSQNFSVNVATGYYILYATPVRLGTVTFTVGGFTGGFLPPQTVSITNASGYTENYYVYRSTNSGLGLTTVTVN